MTGGPGTLYYHLRTVLADPAGRQSDAQLLADYVTRRDPTAFAALVRRHGPMVFAVCRRLLRDATDAEDAFQATFLVLVRKADAIARPECLGNWLYGVAYRTSLKIRANLRRQRCRERALEDLPVATPAAAIVWEELQPIFDEELAGLPEKYRVPVVLCCLGGQTKRQAARQLGWPEGTLSTRLHHGRHLLRQRLIRRGLSLSVGAFAVALADVSARASVPPSLSSAAVRLAAEPAGSVTASLRVASLARQVIHAMTFARLKTYALVTTLLLLAAGSSAAIWPAGTPFGEPERPPTAPPPRASAAEPSAPVPKPLQIDKDVASIIWSPDGKLMASLATRREKRAGGGADDFDSFQTIKVWDAQSGKELASLGEHKNSGLVQVLFTPDGGSLVLSFFRSIQEGARLELWNARKGESTKTIEMDYGRVVPFFDVAPDGKTITVAYAGDEGRDPKGAGIQGGARVWDVATGKVVRSFRGHKSLSPGIAFAPDGKLLATGGDGNDKTVLLWDLGTGKEVRTIKAGGVVSALVFSPDGKTLVGGGGSEMTQWEVATGKELRPLKEPPDWMSHLRVSADGRWLAASGRVGKEDGKVSGVTKLWDLRTGEIAQSWTDTIGGVAFTPDGKAILVPEKGGVVRRWDLPAKKTSKP